MLNLLLWTVTFLGIVALLRFSWRSAMRRRGFRLIRILGAQEGVLRSAVDVRVRRGRSGGVGFFARRGTVVLTSERLAGFAHRARFVLVKGRGVEARTVRAEDGWLVVQPRSREGEAGAPLGFRVEDPEGWAREARRALRGG